MNVFQALADPNRRAIVEMLSPGERSAGEIRAAFHVTAPAVSQHLKALRSAGLVRVRAEAQRRIYRLDPSGLAEIQKWLFRVNSVQGGQTPASCPLHVAALVQAKRLGVSAA